jgi:uncharacterized protein (DUF4415 family)
MAKKKQDTGSVSRKGKRSWVDPDDAPALSAEFFAKAKLTKDGKPVRGRPTLESRKLAVSLRLDPDVIGRYKAKGDGWQTIINAHLRKAVGLPASRTTGGDTEHRVIRKSTKHSATKKAG